MNCRGLHCPGCHRGGPGGVITALLVLFAVSAGARAAARVLPVLLHVLIVTAIAGAAAAATIIAAVLVVRRAARPGRRPVRQSLGTTSSHAVRAAASDWRELSPTPEPRSLPAPAAVPNAAPLPASHQASERTSPP
jgi:hypothetical protein